MIVSFDSNDLVKLETYISSLGDIAENSINEYLHSQGIVEAENGIKSMINIGKNIHSKRQPREHARSANSLKSIPYNLGFKITTNKGYGYLFFPDSGVGKSNPREQSIFEMGFNKKRDFISNQLIEELMKRL